MVAVVVFGDYQLKTSNPTNQTSLERIQLRPVIHLATHHKLGDVIELRPLNRDSAICFLKYRDKLRLLEVDVVI